MSTITTLPRVTPGYKLSDVKTLDDLLTQSRLDFEVVTEPVYDFAGQKNPNAMQTVRTDRCGTDRYLGIVGNGYEPIQNREALQPVFDLLGEHVVFENAWVTYNGARMYIQCRAGEDSLIIDDPIRHSALIASSHDGSGSWSLMDTPTRIGCLNALARARAQSSATIRIRHTRNYEQHLDNVTAMLNEARERQELMANEMRGLAMRSIDEDFVTAFLAALIQPNAEGELTEARRQKRQNIFRLFNEQPGAETKALRGTAYGLYNAVLDDMQWGRTRLTPERHAERTIEQGGKRAWVYDNLLKCSDAASERDFLSLVGAGLN